MSLMYSPRYKTIIKMKLWYYVVKYELRALWLVDTCIYASHHKYGQYLVWMEISRKQHKSFRWYKILQSDKIVISRVKHKWKFIIQMLMNELIDWAKQQTKINQTSFSYKHWPATSDNVKFGFVPPWLVALPIGTAPNIWKADLHWYNQWDNYTHL